MRHKVENGNLPEFDNLFDFYNHIHASPPLYGDFDIREINPETISSYDFVASPFRHRFYCVALYMEGDVTLNAGYWKTRLDRPALYFKTPYQLLSWIKPEKWLKEYFIVFTERFALKYKPLADIIFDLPFFKIEKTVPFEINKEDTETLITIYRKIHQEYRSTNNDKFELINAYLLILLVHVRRLYAQYAETDQLLQVAVKKDDNDLLIKFHSLIKVHISNGEVNGEAHTVRHYAFLLSTHPNHLNAVVKRKSGKTALAHIHQQIITEAKSLLRQTSFPIKDISSRLGFKEPSHFNNFFKRQTKCTPVDYREGIG